jgi:hypothetical protein
MTSAREHGVALKSASELRRVRCHDHCSFATTATAVVVAISNNNSSSSSSSNIGCITSTLSLQVLVLTKCEDVHRDCARDIMVTNCSLAREERFLLPP